VETIQQLCAAMIQVKRWASHGAGFAMKRCFSLDQLGSHPLQCLLSLPSCAHPA
jgi:hypothetical protein